MVYVTDQMESGHGEVAADSDAATRCILAFSWHNCCFLPWTSHCLPRQQNTILDMWRHCICWRTDTVATLLEHLPPRWGWLQPLQPLPRQPLPPQIPQSWIPPQLAPQIFYLQLLWWLYHHTECQRLACNEMVSTVLLQKQQSEPVTVSRTTIWRKAKEEQAALDRGETPAPKKLQCAYKCSKCNHPVAGK